MWLFLVLQVVAVPSPAEAVKWSVTSCRARMTGRCGVPVPRVDARLGVSVGMAAGT